MKTKHTPGPWRIQSEYNYGERISLWVDSDPRTHGDTKSGVKIIVSNFHGHNVDEISANARLIAAAPDLLDVLADIVKSFDVESGPTQAELARAKYVIAKARGES